ncbi:MAG: hypothetical protein O3A00_00170 [Planctomycetota bacterium]|nr:hypothetical protein [Planctomycetota bacterium]
MKNRFNSRLVIAATVTSLIALGAGAQDPIPDGFKSVACSDAVPSVAPEQASPLINPYAERVEYQHDLPHDEESPAWTLTEAFIDALTAPMHPFAHLVSDALNEQHFEPSIHLNPNGIGLQHIPQRPSLVFEWNEGFVEPGRLGQGIELPTGAVWRPSLWVFGTYRGGISYFDNHAGTRFTEWANRLDLFGQLNLSGTERLVVGMRPLDQESGGSRRFTGYDFHGGDSLGGANSDVQSLFFEGDFGEIFPNFDPYDELALDYGFSVGRQIMSFQQGLLINEDMIDAVTATRNTLYGGGNLNLRMTGVYAWNNINRNNNVDDPNAKMVGLFTESDFASSTVNADIAYVNSETSLGSLFAVGLSAIQRLKGFHNVYNTSLHVLSSFPTDGETTASGRGTLLFAQTSWAPHHANDSTYLEDLVYLNAFWAIDQFTSPARGPLAGGPLGQTGILFAAPGLGRFGAPLSNQASDAAGASLGYQMFFEQSRQQLIVEFGGRKDTNDIGDGAIGAGVRYQRAIGQHWIFILDGFTTKREGRGVSPGTRIEFLAKF